MFIYLSYLQILAGNVNDENRQACARATKPLIIAVEGLTTFASSPQFSSIPAKISSQARVAQEPIINVCVCVSFVYCACLFVYIHMYCTYIGVSVSVHMHVCLYIYMCVCLYMYMCRITRVSVYVHVHV